jgi:hypothetical protein
MAAGSMSSGWGGVLESPRHTPLGSARGGRDATADPISRRAQKKDEGAVIDSVTDYYGTQSLPD